MTEQQQNIPLERSYKIKALKSYRRNNERSWYYSGSNMPVLQYALTQGQRLQISNTQGGAFFLGSAVIQNTQSPGSPQNLANLAPLAIQKLQSNLLLPCPRVVQSGCLLYCGAFSHRVLPSCSLSVTVLCPTSERQLKSYTTVAPG